jgi:hypothetical protein
MPAAGSRKNASLAKSTRTAIDHSRLSFHGLRKMGRGVADASRVLRVFEISPTREIFGNSRRRDAIHRLVRDSHG